jgi:integrase/recombinase XerD
MQNQKQPKTTHLVPSDSYALNIKTHLDGDLPFEKPPTQSPNSQLHSYRDWARPTQRERFRTRQFLKIERDMLPNQEQIVRYMRHKFRENCKPNTIRNAYFAIFSLFKFLENSNKDTRLGRVSRSDLEAYVEHEQDRGLMPSTVNNRLWSLYTFFRYLSHEKLVSSDLLDRKINIKLPSALPRSIDPDDEKKLLSVIDKIRDRAMIYMLLRTGMRIGELLKTTMDDIDLREQIIRIYESEKTSIGRVVYFSNDAAEALFLYLQERDTTEERLFYGRSEGSLSYTTAWVIFKGYVDKAGLSHKGYSPHCLRHTFATRLLNAGMHLECVQVLMGHTNIEQTRRYANLSDKRREEEYFKTMAIIEGGADDEHDQFDH